MKKFGMMLALSAAVCGGVFAVEVILKPSDAEDFPKPATLVETDGEKIFEITPGAATKSAKTFMVDQEKTYLLTGSFRNLSKKDISLLFGFVPLDSDGLEILPNQVNCVAETGTELAEDVNVGDVTIKLKDGENWEKAGPYWYISFNVKDDLSDLPNRNLSPLVSSVSGNQVTLSIPIGKGYSAGTKVRAQYAGATYLFTAASNRKINDQWQTFSGKIKGKEWRAGTAKARVLVWQYAAKNDYQSKMQFKDISVEIVD